jgi:hypothetical protein
VIETDLEEDLVRHSLDVDRSLGVRVRSDDLGNKIALGHKVAPELLGDRRVGRDVAGSAVRFQSPRRRGVGRVEVLLVDELLVLRSVKETDTLGSRSRVSNPILKLLDSADSREERCR